MPFELFITETAQEEIKKKLDRSLKSRFDKRMQKLKEAPDVCGKPLRWPLDGTWEIRFENRWRVYYEIDFNKKIVQITGFKHKDETKHS